MPIAITRQIVTEITPIVLLITSNVFAILGLRSMFFALAGIMRLFCFLHYGLAGVLMFVGLKMLLSNVYEIPTLPSLAVVSGILAISIMVSLFRSASRPKSEDEAGPRDGTRSTREEGPTEARASPDLDQRISNPPEPGFRQPR